ncbi:single-strand binding protein [Desulfofarcimen acetoxidans DSM 771]|jgi:single-strand DNA-binding protein|uniref:Single-stranded DNA-binding protein n=1 Tax=Desulfofarcimen acetoxidans (strain ATCC 49208 / DSM 771 / KCTC 5769 / VKM B-1644 / 5575) TaxID=485916 RepID=C8W049_DESAS|nr:single-stranded DNA-binding protein [Desulfofarcimen acetoxidans]ACV65017.1 single-strand binding protein [Desulfofarcimen acetoxidans DSM 771]
MLNKVILIGRLTRDPELRYTPSGVAVTKFTLAVDRSIPVNKGEKEADFIDIVTFQKLAEICSNLLGKGRLVAVDGRLQIRPYEDNQGVRRKSIEIIANEVKFLDKAKDNQRAPGAPSASFSSTGTSSSEKTGSNFGSEIDFSEDDIPF